MELPSNVLSVESDPWLLAKLNLFGSCKEVLKMLDAERIILELEEFAKVSLMRSCKLSYLEHSR